MDPTLETKLAAMVWYSQEVRAKRRSVDTRAFESYLDDPEVTNWLDKMQRDGRIVNTRFTNDR